MNGEGKGVSEARRARTFPSQPQLEIDFDPRLLCRQDLNMRELYASHNRC